MRRRVSTYAQACVNLCAGSFSVCQLMRRLSWENMPCVNLCAGVCQLMRSSLMWVSVWVNQRSRILREGKPAHAVLGKKKAPRRALVFCARFSRARGEVASVELMGQSS